MLGKSPWTGGLIGAGLGAVFGAAIADIASRGSREVVANDQPVEYRTTDGRGVYRAEPVGEPILRDTPRGITKCRKVHEIIWENGIKKEDRIREVCESYRTVREY
ncbi:lipoprotein [Candidatus Magnetoovum chiemensis]|nr:lipoprotein [Candidatus Magnetoovum chiemensis]